MFIHFIAQYGCIVRYLTLLHAPLINSILVGQMFLLQYELFTIVTTYKAQRYG